MAIDCCKNCVPPKRYPGCHSKCKQYLEEKAELERQKEFAKAHKSVVLTKYDFDEIVYADCKRRSPKRRKRSRD